MDIRAAEISSIIKEQIAGFGAEADVAEVGQVISVGDGVARIYGLDNVQAGELVEFPGGISNVQEVDPSLVQGEEGLDRLESLIHGFLDLGGMELSLNFLDEKTLKDAQEDPDRHRYLMVRLFGLSAQFVNLSKEVQDNVIERVVSASRRSLVG